MSDTANITMHKIFIIAEPPQAICSPARGNAAHAWAFPRSISSTVGKGVSGKFTASWGHGSNCRLNSWLSRGASSGALRQFPAPSTLDAIAGEFNESTQHLLILADEEVWEWRGMHGPGSRRNRRLSCGSAGRAVNVWRTSRERLRGGTRAASIGSWLAMEGLLQRHAGGLWERCGLRSAKRFRAALPPVGRYGGSHRASNDRPQLSAERSGVTAAAAPTAPARRISAPGGGHCAQSLVAWRAMPSYDGASRRSSCSSGRRSRSVAG